MESSKRMLINTLVQYVKAIINIALSLFSTRIIFNTLGVSDYGLYAVIAGVVMLLGFITNALVITTQRYISFHYGQGELSYLRKVFSSSLALHILLGLLLMGGLFLLKDIVIFRWLNIVPERLEDAMSVYLVISFVLFVTIVTAPFKAILIAHENIIYISIVEVVDGILKLAIALALVLFEDDRLIMYALLMAGIQVLNFLAFSVYSYYRFEECTLLIRPADVDARCVRQLLSFGSWTTYGMGAVVFRGQGIAILLNHFYGTVMNAAWGIANQVFGAIAFVATSVANAMNPQIIKAEGASQRSRMLFLAQLESKFTTILLLVLILPLVFEMPAILAWWLGTVPEESTLFCRTIMLGLMIDQSTYGLHTANQAMGHIRNYILLMYTPKLLTILFVWLVLYYGYGPVAVMALYLLVEFFVAAARLPYMSRESGLNVHDYFRKVFMPLLPLLVVQILMGYVMTHFLTIPFRFMVTWLSMVLVSSFVVWRYSLSGDERRFVHEMVLHKVSYK